MATAALVLITELPIFRHEQAPPGPPGVVLLSLVLLGPGIYFEIDAALAAAAGPT